MNDEPKLRWFQISLASLLGITAIAAIAAGIFVNWRYVGPLVTITLLALGPFYLVRAFLLWATGLLFRNYDDAP